MTYFCGDAVVDFACLLLFKARSLSPCVILSVSSSSLYWIRGKKPKFKSTHLERINFTLNHKFRIIPKRKAASIKLKEIHLNK